MMVCSFLFFFFSVMYFNCLFFFCQAEDGIRVGTVTGVQTCALPIWFCFQTRMVRLPALTHPLLPALRQNPHCPSSRTTPSVRTMCWTYIFSMFRNCPGRTA